MTEIKPRWEKGVPWCDAGCPQCEDKSALPDAGWVFQCRIDNETQEGDVCPHAVLRMAVERDKLLKDNERARVMYEAEREKVEHYYNHLCTRGFDAPHTILPRSGHSVPTVNIEKLGELMDRHDRMAVELEAWRSGRLMVVRTWGNEDEIGFWVNKTKRFDTIEAAVDALMAEREE